MQNSSPDVISPELSTETALPSELSVRLQDLLVGPDSTSALRMTGWLLAGGFAALYIRFLYRRFSAAASDTDSITRVFPLLLIVTTAVIAVVHTSLALSLGLVGALSIVRFRAAIKDPEELVYLFLCIAVGLALGAEKVFLAIGLLLAATVFVVGMHVSDRKSQNQKLLLTIRAQASRFQDKDENISTIVNALVPNWSLHRMDFENGRGQMRISIARMTAEQTTQLIAQLSSRLPDCELSYVNLDSAV